MTRSRSRRKTIQAIAKLFVLSAKAKKEGRLLQSILSYTHAQNSRKGKTKAIAKRYALTYKRYNLF